MNKNQLMTNKYFVVFGAVLCTFLWGTAPPVIKIGYSEPVFNIASNQITAQIVFAGVRFFVAGLMLIIIGAFTSKKAILPKKADAKPILLLGFVQTSLHYLFTFVGVANTTVTKAAIFTASSAFLSVLAAPIFFKGERLTLRMIIGSVVGFSGIILINFDKSGFLGINLLGDVFVLLASICYVGGNMISKVVAKNRNVSMLNGWQMLFGGGLLILAGTAAGGRLHFTSYRCFIIILYLAAVSAVAFTLWTNLLVHNQMGRLGIYNLLIPVFSTLCAGILLKDDIFNPTTIVSMALVCAGILLVNLRADSKAPKSLQEASENR